MIGFKWDFKYGMKCGKIHKTKDFKKILIIHCTGVVIVVKIINIITIHW